MITILIVSHSHAVAHGVRHLAAQMAHPALEILAVGGLAAERLSGSETLATGGADGDEAAALDEVGYALGTDVAAILAALQAAWSPDGVLILADLGSSIMSAEAALEMLPPEMAAVCCISNAPLVEGAIIAAVEAGLGHDLVTVNRAAEAAATLVKVERRMPPAA